jgi:hypothetical protein
MFLFDQKIEKMLLPYVCLNHPEARAVSFWRSTHKVPSVQEILDGKRAAGDQVGVERKFVTHSFCERVK